VLVTGASGYIAAHVVQQLQREGYRVRGTVRSLASAEKTEPLRQLVPDAIYPLELVEANLEKNDGWDEAVSGCWAVLHTASPLPDIFTEIQATGSLVGPAVGGTRRVMEAAGRAGVERVVMTSSIASIMGGYKTVDFTRQLTEADWTDPNNSDVSEYSKSKTLAEREAWKIHESLPEGQRYSLSMINPALVLGPPLIRANNSSATVGLVTKIISREYSVFPDVSVPMCDVRDVASAHVKALTAEGAPGNRHIIVHPERLRLPTLADIVSEELSPLGYSIPTRRLPYWIVWLFGFCSPKARESKCVWGKDYNLSNRRMVEVLGVRPTPYRNTIIDMIHAVIALQIVPKTEKYRISRN